MSSRISSSDTQSLQRLQAMQAFRPTAAKPTNSTQGSSDDTAFPIDEAILSSGQSFKSPPENNRSTAINKPTLPFQEIQAVAQQAGYVGLTEKDIIRAYNTGQSLLADYRA